MKKYLLLRDNHESGPFSLEEISELGLSATDLIWIEGRSNSWEYPGDVEDLGTLVSKTGDLSPDAPKIFVALPPNFSRRNRDIPTSYASLPVNEMEPVLETSFVHDAPEFRERTEAPPAKPMWEK